MEALASAEIVTSDAAMGTAFAQAPTLRPWLEGDDWPLFEKLQSIGDGRAAAAKKIVEDIKEALTSDEHVIPLKTTLSAAKRRAIDLLAEGAAGTQPVETPSTQPEPPKPQPGRRVIEKDRRTGLGANEARSLFGELQGKLDSDPRRSASVEWTIDEPEEPS